METRFPGGGDIIIKKFKFKAQREKIRIEIQ